MEQKFSSKRVTTVSLTFPDFSLTLPIEREELLRYIVKDYKSLGIHSARINSITRIKRNTKFAHIPGPSVNIMFSKNENHLN